jgi:hypothetical protein
MGKLICFNCGHAMSDHMAVDGKATCTHTDNHGRLCGCTIDSK